ncbi:MAG: T9SS C-terminal target domain-containing protein, partial [Calditrichaeota bacterium]
FIAFLITWGVSIFALSTPLMADDDIKVRGAIEDLGNETITVSGQTFLVDVFTEIRDKDYGTDLTFGQLQIGDRVKIKGKWLSDGTAYARKIERENFDDDDHHEEIEVKGSISEMDGFHFVVAGFPFYADSATVVYDEHDRTLAFSDLAPGDYVEVEGSVVNDSLNYARKIKRESENDEDNHNKIKTEGAITALGTNWFEVSMYRIYVDDRTEYKSDDPQFGFASLAVGLSVEVEAVFMDSVWTAMKVEDESERDHDNDHDSDEIEMYGRIDSLYDGGLVVNFTDIQVTENTRIKLRHDSEGTFSDLRTGMYVEIEYYSTDSANVAKKIKVKSPEENEVAFTGAIDSVGADFIDVLGIRVWVTVSTEIFDYQHQTLAFGDLEKGLRVKVKGMLQTDSSVVARRIKVKRFYTPHVEVRGHVEAISAATLTVDGRVFQMDSSTVILDSMRQIISWDQLALGTPVEVKAGLRSDSLYYALRVRVEKKDRKEVQLTATVDSIGVAFMVVGGQAFVTDAQTEVFDLNGQPMSYDSLRVSDLVEIKGVYQNDGQLLATEIKLEDTPDMILVVGTVSARSGSTIWVNGPAFEVTSRSVVLDEQFKPTDISTYAVGSVVTIWARPGAQGSPSVVQSKLGETSVATGIAPTQAIRAIPRLFDLQSNYPNPFNPETTIRFALNSNGFEKVRLEVFDINGRHVATLYNGVLNGGTYNFKWNGRNTTGHGVASGTYLYRLTVNNQTQSRKMILLR